MSRSQTDYLRHILDEARYIESALGDIPQVDFIADTTEIPVLRKQIELDLRKHVEHDEKKACHPERSEGSLPKLSLRLGQAGMLRSAQHDTFLSFA